jgi:FtsP/CotA-like multicopper oxidase with cupredoxin domain
MDKYFLECIHPILLSTQWEKLKKITIRGVGGKSRGLNGSRTPRVEFRTWEPDDPVVFEIAEDRLRLALGERVEVEWDVEVGRTFYLHEGSNYTYLNAAFHAY